MSEDAPSALPSDEASADSATSSTDESQRIEDPQKARAMAEAGDWERSSAAWSRELSAMAVGAKDDPPGKGREPYESIAKDLDESADIKEGEVARSYEQSVDATEGIGETAVGSATQVSVAEAPNDTRWDLAKSQTVGMAAKEEDRNYRLQYEPDDARAFNNERLKYAREKARKLNIGDEDAVAYAVKNSSPVYKLDYEELQKLKSEIADLQTGGEEVPELLSKRLEVLQRRYDEQAEYLRGLENRMLRAGERQRDEAIDQVIKPFEELYDLNPELFAKMPVPEFIEANRELREIEQDLVRLETGQKRIIEGAEEIKSKIENRELIEWPIEEPGGPVFDIYRSIPDELRGVIYGADTVLSPQYVYNGKIHGEQRGRLDNKLLEVLNKYEAVPQGDSFDRSPHQIMEAYLELTNDYIDQARALFADAKKRKQDFMSKYGKGSEVDQQAEDTS